MFSFVLEVRLVLDSHPYQQHLIKNCVNLSYGCEWPNALKYTILCTLLIVTHLLFQKKLLFLAKWPLQLHRNIGHDGCAYWHICHLSQNRHHFCHLQWKLFISSCCPLISPTLAVITTELTVCRSEGGLTARRYSQMYSPVVVWTRVSLSGRAHLSSIVRVTPVQVVLSLQLEKLTQPAAASRKANWSQFREWRDARPALAQQRQVQKSEWDCVADTHTS